VGVGEVLDQVAERLDPECLRPLARRSRKIERRLETAGMGQRSQRCGQRDVARQLGVAREGPRQCFLSLGYGGDLERRPDANRYSAASSHHQAG
jgi:hypothetical protein